MYVWPEAAGQHAGGKVVDLLKNTVVASGIREPHSVCLFDELTFVLKLIAGDLVEFKKGFYPRRICGICGYARGLLIEHATIVIGSCASTFRRCASDARMSGCW